MAAQGLRQAADDAARFVLMSLLGILAGAIVMLCLSGAAFVLLSDRLGAAEAWGVLGAFYALAAVGSLLVRRRRR